MQKNCRKMLLGWLVLAMIFAKNLVGMDSNELTKLQQKLDKADQMLTLRKLSGVKEVLSSVLDVLYDADILKGRDELNYKILLQYKNMNQLRLLVLNLARIDLEKFALIKELRQEKLKEVKEEEELLSCLEKKNILKITSNGYQFLDVSYINCKNINLKTNTFFQRFCSNENQQENLEANLRNYLNQKGYIEKINKTKEITGKREFSKNRLVHSSSF